MGEYLEMNKQLWDHIFSHRETGGINQSQEKMKTTDDSLFTSDETLGTVHWRMKHSDGVRYLSSCPEMFL
jgi:hypothetical protein